MTPQEPREADVSGAAGGAPVAVEHGVLVEAEKPDIVPARGRLGVALHWLGVGEQAAGAALLVVLLVLVLVQVGQRYLPEGGWAWTGEVARLCLVWATFVTSGYLLAHDRHVAIHVIDYLVPARALAVVKGFVYVVVALTCIGLMLAALELVTTDRGQVTPAAGIPLSVVYSVVLVGCALTALRAVLAVVLRVGRRTGDPSEAAA